MSTLNKSWYINTKEYYSVRKRNERYKLEHVEEP